MAKHNELGRVGESIAREYLITKGYIIRETNWRCNKLEIDIVAEKQERIVIVEVKTRSSDVVAQPIDAITRDKVNYLLRAARSYIKMCQVEKELQFDIITLVGTDPKNMKLEHIEDAIRVPIRTYR